jgi:hypothetical protein
VRKKRIGYAGNSRERVAASIAEEDETALKIPRI